MKRETVAVEPVTPHIAGIEPCIESEEHGTKHRYAQGEHQKGFQEEESQWILVVPASSDNHVGDGVGDENGYEGNGCLSQNEQYSSFL